MIIKIKLSPKQKTELAPLFDLANTFNELGQDGAVFGQVHESGEAYFMFLQEEGADAIQNIISNVNY